MIEYKHVALRYTDKNILKDVNLRIEDGEFMVLVGPSGSGKTTMIKMINRLLEPTDGNIYMDEKRIKDYDERELRLSTGYVLQAIALFPNLTVAENIALIPEMKGWTKEQITSKTVEFLEKVGLPASDYAARKPHELSGGEQQRVGIVRAMIGEPKILLMDEPFSALDAISRKQLQTLTKNLHKEFGMTTIFVTHDTDEALKLGDRIAVITDLAPCYFSGCSSSYLFKYAQKSQQLGFTVSRDLPDHSFHGSFGALHTHHGDWDLTCFNRSCHLRSIPDFTKYYYRFTGN